MTPDIIALSEAQARPTVLTGCWARPDRRQLVYEARATQGSRTLMASLTHRGNDAWWPTAMVLAEMVPTKRPRRAMLKPYVPKAQRIRKRRR